MQNATFRSVVVLALLVGGLLILYTPQCIKNLQNQTPLDNLPVAEAATSTENDETDETDETDEVVRADEVGEAEGVLSYIVDLDYWQRTERERIVETNFHFDLAHDLNELPLQIGDWQGEDVPETNIEVFILLEPEQFVQRRYRNSQGQRIWLNLIGSRKSRSFHPPDLCYTADGWQAALSSQVIPLDGGGELYGLWLEAEKDYPGNKPPSKHRVFYFYLFPDSQRDQADGIILFKLTSLQEGTIEETIALQRDFLQHLFSKIRPVG